MIAGAKPKAVIIDGATLLLALGHEPGSGRSRGRRQHQAQQQRQDLSDLSSPKNLLLRLVNQCKAVVACRVSPDQKRELVALVKNSSTSSSNSNNSIRTLAVGDGANDVAMIQEAHIGVGIKGEEGLQAVNSADYAIAQFRYLSVLLLKHGRYNNINMSKLVCYMFYKNILMSMGQFWFNFNNGFSGQKYYTEGAIQLFNLIYSAFPILLLGIYDKDINPELLYRYPQLYQAVVNYEFFNVSIVLVDSFICFFYKLIFISCCVTDKVVLELDYHCYLRVHRVLYRTLIYTH